MPGDFGMDSQWLSSLSDNLEFDDSFLDAQLENLMPIPRLTPFSSSLSGRIPLQLDPGNVQTNTGSTIYAQALQPPPSPNQPTEQSRQLAPAPCVGCTRRMAKIETNNKEAMKKADACHFQSNLKSNKCRACRDRHRRCDWIEETEIQALARGVQSAFQRVKEKGHGSYSKEEKELSRHALFKLQGKYSAAGGARGH